MTTGFFFSSFPSPHSFLFLCYYDFGASRAKETCLLTLFIQMTANFFGLVFKKSARCFQTILPICQSVPFACCRRCFRSFGINAAHSLDHCFQRILAICQSVHLHMADGVSGDLASMLFLSLDYRPFASNSFFRPKLSLE